MQIPSSFTLGPQTITVKVVTKAQMLRQLKEPLAEDEDVPLGLWKRDCLTIWVQQPRRGFTEAAQAHTFWHEFTHAMLELMSYDTLSADEQFVDRVGWMLLQASQSFSYGE